MSQIINVVGVTQFEESVLKSNLPVLVDFWAPWCMPCKMMAPVLEELAVSLNAKLQIAKVDTEVESNQKLAFDYQIRSIPNLKLFINGKIIKEYVGFRPKEILEKEIIKDLSDL